MEGRDYDPVVPLVAAQAPAAPLALNVAATSSQSILSPAERIAQIRSMMARRRGRFGGFAAEVVPFPIPDGWSALGLRLERLL
jgi:hypothetical protein